MKHPLQGRRARSLASGLALTLGLALLAQCRSSAPAAAPRADALDAWQTVYAVLQHPRCLNCHPAGDRPLQGDASTPHGQNVRRGPDGGGLFAMRCTTCHREENNPDAHQPPGAPNWHLPHPDMPLVFEGLSSGALCRQLSDPARNGHKSPAQLLAHVADDELVGWGWHPGPGRVPVPIAREELVAAFRAWIAGGCQCPE